MGPPAALCRTDLPTWIAAALSASFTIVFHHYIGIVTVVLILVPGLATRREALARGFPFLLGCANKDVAAAIGAVSFVRCLKKARSMAGEGTFLRALLGGLGLSARLWRDGLHCRPTGPSLPACWLEGPDHLVPKNKGVHHVGVFGGAAGAVACCGQETSVEAKHLEGKSFWSAWFPDCGKWLAVACHATAEAGPAASAAASRELRRRAAEGAQAPRDRPRRSARRPGGQLRERPGSALGQGAPGEPPPAGGAELLELRVFSLAGAPLCELQCSPQTPVTRVKQRIARLSGVPEAEQRLVHGGALMRDESTLEGCLAAGGEAAGGAIVIQCVRSGLSSASRHLEGLSRSQDPEIAIDAVMSSIVNEVCRAGHKLSERNRPRSAGELAGAIDPRHRAELINWMVQAFDVLRFDDGILHSVVLTLDRYYAARAQVIDVTEIQRVLLSAVCTEMKLCGTEDFPRGRWQQVLAHLCHGRISLQAILQTEFEVLAQLHFAVCVPTTLTFLRELGLHVQGKSFSGKQPMVLALFLLELALFEPALQYGHSHVVLAAAALSGALRSLEEAMPQHQGECLELRGALMQDLVAYSPSQLLESDEVLDCEEELLGLWWASATGASSCTWAAFYPHLVTKFARRLWEPGGGGLGGTGAAGSVGGAGLSAAAALAARARLRSAGVGRRRPENTQD